MATLRKRTTQNGVEVEEWVVYFYKQDGKRSSKAFGRRSQALAFEKQARLDRAEAKPKLIRSQNQFRDAVKRYREDSIRGRDGGDPWSDTSVVNFDRRTKVLSQFVDFDDRLASMNSQRLRQIRTAIQESGVARSSQITYWTLVKSILTHATLEGLMSSNPAHGMRMRSRRQIDAGEEKFEVFSKEEAASIVQAARRAATSENPARRDSFERLYLVPSFLFDLGLRIGELQALEWDNIDLVRGSVLVCQDLNRQGQVQRVKTIDSHRRLLLSDKMVEALAVKHAKFGGQFVFSTKEGKPLQYRNFLRWWHSLCVLAGVEKGGFHKARHYYASRLIEAGVNPKVLTTNMGHADVAFTLQVYGHLFDDRDTWEQKRDIANAVSTVEDLD